MPSSPQRQRDRSPMKQGGGYPHPGMYGMPQYGGQYESSPPRGFGGAGGGGGPTPPQYGGPPPPQGFHPGMLQHGGPNAAAAAAAAMGQFGQYPFYGGGYPGHPPNGYFPHAQNHPELGPRVSSTGSTGGGSFQGGGGQQYPSGSPTRRPGNSLNPSPTDDKVPPQSYYRGKPVAHPLLMKDTSSIDSKSPDKSSSLQEHEEEKSAHHHVGDGEFEDGEEEETDEDFTSGVNPMRSDFHFFAISHKEENMQKIKESSKEGETKSPFLTITELNERLLKLWEDTPARAKAVFLQKEEADRYRFMSEDEIASRHCATLTSRTSLSKKGSPSAPISIGGEGDLSKEGEEKNGSKRQSLDRNNDDKETVTTEYESPTKKIKASSDPKEVEDCDNKDQEDNAQDIEKDEKDEKVDITSNEKDDVKTKDENTEKASSEKIDDGMKDQDAQKKEPTTIKEEDKQEESKSNEESKSQDIEEVPKSQPLDDNQKEDLSKDEKENSIETTKDAKPTEVGEKSLDVIKEKESKADESQAKDVEIEKKTKTDNDA